MLKQQNQFIQASIAQRNEVANSSKEEEKEKRRRSDDNKRRTSCWIYELKKVELKQLATNTSYVWPKYPCRPITTAQYMSFAPPDKTINR
jgi:hypothetical protein